MINIKINCDNTNGNIKCINAVNNGPVGNGVRAAFSNFEAYKAACIPYARNHDASFNSEYNGEHIVDVHRIFRDFNADENDPASYIFEPTDKYILNTISAGTKIFYRLGASIEHGYKYGTIPPKDFNKWARICEHIIMHYNKGWANGFELGIDYWEIWNEADCKNPDGSNPCWQGTDEEFVELYSITARYLKSRFPEIKIGGPAFCMAWDAPIKEKFFTEIKNNNVPLDFYSFHCYGKVPESFAEAINVTRDLLKKYNISENTELILDEWNYVKGWLGNDWVYTIKNEKGLKGASFISAVMAVSQKCGLDMLMYYDARPCNMNGMFETGYLTPLKGYYPFFMVKDVVALGRYIPTEFTDGIYSIASTDGKNVAVMVTYFDDEDDKQPKDITLSFDNIMHSSGIKVEFYLLDENNNARMVREEYVTSSKFNLNISIAQFSTYLIKIVVGNNI